MIFVADPQDQIRIRKSTRVRIPGGHKDYPIIETGKPKKKCP